MCEVNPGSGSELEQNAEYGIVVHTDGGAMPNPGNMGWGAHGYLYKRSEKPVRIPGLPTHVPTTAGYVMPSQLRDEHICVEPLKFFNFFGSTKVTGTNNAAELDALYYTLDKIKDFNVSTINVYTDSEYVRRGLTEWVASWKASNWKKRDGTPVQNCFHWQRLSDLFNSMNSEGKTVRVDWVKGHSDNIGNIIADRFASIGAIHSANGIHCIEHRQMEPQECWKVDVKKHPFLGYRRLYFNSLREHNTLGHYYMSDSTLPELVVGKKTPETSYAVVKLHQVDPVIESIREKQFESSCDINAVMLMRLDKVFSDDVYPYLQMYGKNAMLCDRRGTLNISYVDRKPITVEMNPTGLSLRAIECLGLLEELLVRYQKIKDGVEDQGIKATSLEAHDISSVFYEIDITKKKNTTKLKSDFGVGHKNTDVEIDINHNGQKKRIKVPLVFGSDILARNSLKQIETMEPKVTLLTWKESDLAIRYACVIEVTNGIGIWSNYYANRIFLD